MNKLKMQSADVVADNVQKIATLFPHCVTEVLDKEGKQTLAIDFDKLKDELSKDIVEGDEQRYQFTWPNKRDAIHLANTPTTKTLRPCREESVDFDKTQNLYIEGDNLEVLKCLRNTYLNKVKMIYIDPPYNTGNDFIYNDKFDLDKDEYLENSGQFDDDGNQLVANTESNGRFHTDWLNMMYPRLKVARDLLTEDGVIFISMDDSEVDNLKNICDEIFGGNNYIATVIWERAYSPINLKKHFSSSHDYILCYAKCIDRLVCNGIPRTEETNNRYSNPDNDPRGVWKSSDLSVGPAIQENVYPITTPSGRVVNPPSGYSWRLSKSRLKEYIEDNRIYFGKNEDATPSIKRFLSELEKKGVTPMTVWKYTDVGHSQDATKFLMSLFDNKKIFDYPKPVDLIKRCLYLYTNKESIVLDFFSGSATTAHAVMQLNVEDEGNRKFVMVQLPEVTNEKSEAFKNGFKNICEIGKERIRRAGNKIKAEYGDKARDLDTGFRVLKLDLSNMRDVYYTPSETTQDLFAVDNVKADRTSLDLLFQVMLEHGIELSSSIEKISFNNNDIYI